MAETRFEFKLSALWVINDRDESGMVPQNLESGMVLVSASLY